MFLNTSSKFYKGLKYCTLISLKRQKWTLLKFQHTLLSKSNRVKGMLIIDITWLPFLIRWKKFQHLWLGNFSFIDLKTCLDFSYKKKIITIIFIVYCLFLKVLKLKIWLENLSRFADFLVAEILSLYFWYSKVK